MTILEANAPFAIGMKICIAKKGLKQIAIARNTGYSAQELNDMLNGRRLIKACDISRLARSVDESIDTIYRIGKEGG